MDYEAVIWIIIRNVLSPKNLSVFIATLFRQITIEA